MSETNKTTYQEIRYGKGGSPFDIDGLFFAFVPDFARQGASVCIRVWSGDVDLDRVQQVLLSQSSLLFHPDIICNYQLTD